jgi:hypothetical protein
VGDRGPLRGGGAPLGKRWAHNSWRTCRPTRP